MRLLIPTSPVPVANVRDCHGTLLLAEASGVCVAVVDHEPTANLGHPHTYVVVSPAGDVSDQPWSWPPEGPEWSWVDGTTSATFGQLGVGALFRPTWRTLHRLVKISSYQAVAVNGPGRLFRFEAQDPVTPLDLGEVYEPGVFCATCGHEAKAPERHYGVPGVECPGDFRPGRAPVPDFLRKPAKK